jgi:VanZ family protein
MIADDENTNLMNFKNHGRGRFWRYAPLICWIVVVFIFSSGTGSMSTTSRFIRPLLEFLFPTYSEPELVVIHAYIRKCAHFILYFVLGFLAARAFKFSLTLRRVWFAISLFLVVFIAAVDETNQSFNAARTGAVTDVLLDTFGGATAIALCWLWWHLKPKTAN